MKLAKNMLEIALDFWLYLSLTILSVTVYLVTLPILLVTLCHKALQMIKV